MNTKFLIGVFALASAIGYAGIDVTITTNPDEKWTKEETELVEKAARLTFERMVKANVANCAYRNTTKFDRKHKTKDRVRKAWGSQIPVLNKRRKVHLTVHKRSLGDGVLGRAKVGVATVDRSSYELGNLEISLSKERINQHVNGYSKTSGTNDFVNKWVSVIAHEIGHNFGHSHGNSGDWHADYPGYFVTELGFCTMTDGKHGSDLGNKGR